MRRLNLAVGVSATIILGAAAPADTSSFRQGDPATIRILTSDSVTARQLDGVEVVNHRDVSMAMDHRRDPATGAVRFVKYRTDRIPPKMLNHYVGPPREESR